MQPLAAAARRRGGGGRLVVTLTFLLLAVSRSAVAFCPVGCLCDDDKLQVTCDDVNLEVIPITLNPSVEVCVYYFSQFFFSKNFKVKSRKRILIVQSFSFSAAGSAQKQDQEHRHGASLLRRYRLRRLFT